MNSAISRAWSARPLPWVLPGLLSVALASGCASMTSIEDAVPAAALQQPAEAETVDIGTEAAGIAPHGEVVASAVEEDAATADVDATAAEMAVQPPAPRADRSDYPNLNIRPRSAAPVFTNVEQRREAGELRGIRRDRQSARHDDITHMTPEEMRRLAEQRTDETIRRIEGD